MASVSISVNNLRNAYQALSVLGQIKFPHKTSYWLGRLTAKLEGEFKASEKTRLEILETHGTKNENGDFQIHASAKTAIKKFNADWDPIAESFVDLDNITKLNISAFEGISIEPILLQGLAPFLVDDDEVASEKAANESDYK